MDPRGIVEKRVLLLALTAKDAELTQRILSRAGVECLKCASLRQVCDDLNVGAGAVLIPEEAVVQSHDPCLAVWLAGQPPWSDLPVLVSARPGADSAAVAQAMDILGNVTVLERPMRVAALVSAVRTALRARHRQYLTRDQMLQVSRSERDLRDFFENASVGLHWVGPDGTILQVNQTELEMLGYAREEYVGRHIAEFHVDQPVIEEILARLSAGETLREFPARIRSKDGTILDVRINSNVLFEDGRFIHTRCFTRDVTELKRASEARSRLAAIVDSSDDAIISKSLDGVIQTWNAGAERLFGYAAAEVIGKPITILIPADRQDEEPALLARLRRGERIDHFETIRVTKHGRQLNISLSVSPIRDAEGEIIGAAKVARDITQQKIAEQQLRQREAESRRLLELHRTTMANLGEGVYTVDRQGLVTYVNHEAERLFGWTAAELLGKRMHDVTHYQHPDGSPFPIEECSGFRVLHEGRVLRDFEDTFIRKDGTFFPVAYSSSPLRDADDQIIGLVVAFQDITERKLHEQALRDADRRKDEFLAMLAHELRNPLAPIRNSLNLLQLMSQSEPTVQQIGQMMERQVNHMVRLVDDLLEVSRITRGKIELRLELVELAGVVRTSIETSQALITAAGHQLAVSLPADPLTVNADPVRLSQIISNLLNNSAKYTEAGGQIWLTVRREDDCVAISVRDNGIGIAAAMLPHVFQLFTQVDRQASRAQGGLGIGLTLVKSLTEMHGGQVHAHSAGLGQGSEFVVRLPLAAEQAGSKAPRAEDRPRSGFAPRRILVVDDNRDAAKSMSMLLKVLGSDVRVAFSGPEALQAMAEYQPAIVLLDIGMPGMDGYEVVQRIRAQGQFDDVVLIALTGWGQEDDRRRSQSAGFDHHLTKPADISALEALLVSLQSQE